MNIFKWKAASFLDPSKQFLIASPSVVPSVKNWWVIQDLQLRWCSTMHFAVLRFNYALCSVEVQLCTLQYWGSTMHFVVLRFNSAPCSIIEVQLYTLHFWGTADLQCNRLKWWQGIFFFLDKIAFIHQSFLRRLDFYGDTILIKVVVRYVLLYEVKTNCIAGCILLQSEAALFEPWPTTCLPSTRWPWSTSPLTPASTTAW